MFFLKAELCRNWHSVRFGAPLQIECCKYLVQVRQQFVRCNVGANYKQNSSNSYWLKSHLDLIERRVPNPRHSFKEGFVVCYCSVITLEKRGQKAQYCQNHTECIMSLQLMIIFFFFIRFNDSSVNYLSCTVYILITISQGERDVFEFFVF